jgi:peptidoglycan/xylan/chitin deacetylase (PgdA/CDA1 family)
VRVRHGDHVLESIQSKTEAIPFKTTVRGKGVVVSLVQKGKQGTKTIYVGSASKKQAAAFLVAPAQDAIVQRSAGTKNGQKLAALTFDDGPSKWTQGVLDALAAKHVPATFFMLGSSAAGNKALVQKVKAAGHEVENHSWDHPVLTKLTADQVRSQISRTAAVIGGGYYLRPPYGTYNASVAAVAGSLGYSLVLWTVDTLDWKTRNVDSILANVKRETKPGAIILMHDGGADRSQTVAAIPKVVDWLLQNGYSLTTVENLL